MDIKLQTSFMSAWSAEEAEAIANVAVLTCQIAGCFHSLDLKKTNSQKHVRYGNQVYPYKLYGKQVWAQLTPSQPKVGSRNERNINDDT